MRASSWNAAVCPVLLWVMGACTRLEARDSVSPGVLPAALPAATTPPPAPPTSGAVLLPRNARLVESGDDLPFGLAAGAPASPAHPAGTVFVAGSPDGLGPRVTEYDLASGQDLRGVSLPVPPESAEMMLVAAREGLGVLSWVWNGDAQYLRLGPELDVRAHVTLGQLSVFGPSAFVGDEDRMLVLAYGVLPSRDRTTEAYGTFLVSFDGSGVETARRMWPREGPLSTEQMHGNVVLAGGHAYALLTSGVIESISLLELDKALNTVRQVTIPSPVLPINSTTLEPAGDHLQVDWWGKADVTDVTLDLGALTQHARGPTHRFKEGQLCVDRTVVGDVDVAICNREPRQYIEWARRRP